MDKIMGILARTLIFLGLLTSWRSMASSDASHTLIDVMTCDLVVCQASGNN